ncbi:MAG: DUF177 domain-containing protein [Hydrogenothermaceae bacterium]|nr:DUF177 domain-containing protein [Hydrogenothermaceae bacterium]
MVIFLNLKEELKKEPFKELNFEIPVKDLDLPENYIFSESEKIPVHLHLLKDKDGYIITISIDTSINMTCDRCLVEFPQKFAFSESVLFTKKLPKHSELSEEELLTEYLEDEEKFNLNEFVREEILVNTPMKVLCKEDCKGLCPFCGIDKNIESCDCERKYLREISPFSKLQGLLK